VVDPGGNLERILAAAEAEGVTIEKILLTHAHIDHAGGAGELTQAVRRIIPPLLNDFIGLQKDTALVSVIGVIDAFNQAKIVASNHFSLSPVTTVAFLFVVITIPQARLVDRLIERDQRRMRAGG